jgi:hypothetical protein
MVHALTLHRISGFDKTTRVHCSPTTQKELSMSHIVSIKTKVRDPAALAAACRRLGLNDPTTGTAKLFSDQATGLIVQLPGWQYPIVIDTASGEIKYDNFNGYWGDQSELDKLMQAYAAAKVRAEARRAGHNIIEQQLPNGSLKLTIQLGGAA